MPIIQALDRALNIVDLFDEYTTELKITEISERIGLHKSTVHSLLKTLQLHGYIDQDSHSGKYRLGMRFLEKGQLLLQQLDIRQVARKHLVSLSSNTGQTTNLVVRDGKEGVYIDKVEGVKATILYSRVGRRIPLHTSAVGKVLAAYMDRDERAQLLQNYHYTRHTPNTIIEPERFVVELESVRVRGYAIDNEENESGVRCAAAPIFGHSGSIIAAMSLSTLVSAVDDTLFEQYIVSLCQEAASISALMGYRG